MFGKTKKHGHIVLELGTFPKLEKERQQVRKVIKEVVAGGVHTYN